MSVTIVRGVASGGRSSGRDSSATSTPGSAALKSSLVGSSAVVRQVSTEAAISFVRVSRSAGKSDKIRVHEEAKKTAGDLADRVRDHDPEGEEAHAKLEASQSLVAP